MTYLYEKDEVVKFLMKYHETHYNKPISKIKLQKGLYFLYAYFYKFIQTSSKSELADHFTSVPEDLFKANFQAWSYGPVDKDVYRSHNNGFLEYSDFDIEEFLEVSNNEEVKDMLVTLTNEIFESSDFGLVELSHMDDCWKSQYDPSLGMFNQNVISAESIKREYASKI